MMKSIVNKGELRSTLFVCACYSKNLCYFWINYLCLSYLALYNHERYGRRDENGKLFSFHFFGTFFVQLLYMVGSDISALDDSPFF